MYLWLLTPTKLGEEELGKYWNFVHRCVVRAKSSVQARKFAAIRSQCEGAAFWADRTLVSCKKLKAVSKEGIVIQDCFSS